MAEMTQQNFRDQVKQVLEDGLRLVGIDGSVDVEEVPRTRMCRVYIVTPNRDSLTPTEWQKLTSRLIRDRLGEEGELRIGMIYTVTPEELASYRADE